MILNIISIMTLGILITVTSFWWVRTTLKEGNNVLKDSNKNN